MSGVGAVSIEGGGGVEFDVDGEIVVADVDVAIVADFGADIDGEDARNGGDRGLSIGDQLGDFCFGCGVEKIDQHNVIVRRDACIDEAEGDWLQWSELDRL